MNLIFVGDRCNDHSPSSGYDQVCSLFPEAGWLSGRELEACKVQWHREPKETVSPSPKLFHVIYGDCSGKRLPELLRRKYPEARIVSSAHQPIRRLEADPVARDALNASDAIIVVSEIQARQLRELTQKASIFTIPHGVWTKVFRPTSRVEAALRTDVFLVGSFLRDWDGAREVTELLWRAGVHSVALGAGARDQLIGTAPYLEVLPRVSEAELARIYERAAAIFLPFLDATASNALLEAMVAGCPVVCPRLPSLVDYLYDDSDTFDVGRYDRAAARLLHYVRCPSDREERGHALMMWANQFDWSKIRHRYEQTYAEIQQRSFA